jgi:hypothetical protein
MAAYGVARAEATHLAAKVETGSSWSAHKDERGVYQRRRVRFARAPAAPERLRRTPGPLPADRSRPKAQDLRARSDDGRGPQIVAGRISCSRHRARELLHGLGLPTHLFTPTFAIGRVAGWAAHCLEQQAEDRLIRPQIRVRRCHRPVLGAARGPVDRRVAGVGMRKEDDAVIGEVYGEVGVGVMRRQVARILSLDVDGLGFYEGAERDPVVRGLQQRHPGLRPVCLHSPSEAAWAVHRPLRPRSAGRKGQGPHGRGVGAGGESREQNRTRLPRFLPLGGVGRVSGVDRLRHLARAAGEGRLEEDFCACCLLGRLPCPGFGSRLASGRSPRN